MNSIKVLIGRVTGQLVLSGIHLYGKRVNQALSALCNGSLPELDAYLPARRSTIKRYGMPLQAAPA
jgi:hypothetical protein